MSKLKPYQVSYHEEKGDKLKLFFFCMAEDDDHAAEQTELAYPGCEVILTTQVAEEDYPYNIHEFDE